MVRAATTAPAAFQLFRVKDVIDALGASDASDGEADDTGHRRRLRAIMGKGANAATRRLATPRCSPPSTRAPHMDDFVGLVRRGLLACEAIGMPLGLPPTVLVGPPGTGKTWLLQRLCDVLSLPSRSYPINAATLSDGLQGGHPSWRNAREGRAASRARCSTSRRRTPSSCATSSTRRRRIPLPAILTGRSARCSSPKARGGSSTNTFNLRSMHRGCPW